jgi:signal transduction histidine kinase
VSTRYFEINGEFTVCAFDRDITERKKAEKIIKESEEKLNALFSAMTELVVVFEMIYDSEGKPVDYRFLECNQAYLRAYGTDKETVIGKRLSEVYQGMPVPHLEEFAEVVRTGEPFHFDYYFPLKEKYFTVSAVSPGKGKFATISFDITDKKRADKLIEEKNKELEQIIYVASHDLRSPLVNVDGYSREIEYIVDDYKKILSNDEVAYQQLVTVVRSSVPEIEEALKHIRNSAKQMDALLKGLLKLSRSGRAALNIVLLNMDDLVTKVVSSMDFLVTSAKVDLHIEELHPCMGDEVQVTQVFSNLIGNALKFLNTARQGKINVSSETKKNFTIYCIEDNGIGIAREHQDNIFQLFHRLDPKKVEGEGLGLTIVRQSLARMNGKVWVESKPGIGSRFYVSLPNGVD